MTNVVCVVGLPGSGKTFHVNRFIEIWSNKHKDTKIKFIDDIKNLEELPTPGEVDILIIADPYFCKPDTRRSAGTFLSLRYDNLNWVFFENNPEKCKRNVEHRNDGRKVNSLIDILTKDYIIPDNALLLTVWQPPSPEK